MNIPFFKYQGTGNDFVIIDDRGLTFPSSDQNVVERLCHRRYGIGADGLILLQEDSNGLRMKYYNSDGRESTMCGNGGRCFSAVLVRMGMAQVNKETTFQAIDGLHHTLVYDDGNVKLKMIDVPLPEQLGEEHFFINTGSPHQVILVNDIDSIEIEKAALPYRHAQRFTADGGTNVNFVEIHNNGGLRIRTFERGVEAETYSCGTGAVAAAVCAATQMGGQHSLSLDTKGGILKVDFNQHDTGFSNIFLTGPATFVFEGQINF